MNDRDDIDGINDAHSKNGNDDFFVKDDWGTTILSNDQRKYVERRKRKDWVVRSVTVIAILGWICALLALIFIDRASPAEENFITRLLGVTVISYWNSTLLRWAFAATLGSFASCLVGFVLNATRHRRKTDRYNKLLIFISIASAVIFVIFLVNFSGYL